MKHFIMLFLFLSTFSFITPQSAVFDYQHEELPAMSLNGIPYYDARLLTFGGNPLMSATPLAAICNPASLPDHNRLSLSMTGKRRSAFQFWGINEGLLTTSRAVSDRDFSFSAAAVCLKLSHFTLGAGFAETAIRAFPSFQYLNTDLMTNGSYSYRYFGNFGGIEKTVFISLKKHILRCLAAGVTLTCSRTNRRVSVTESWEINYSTAIPQTDSLSLFQREEHILTGFSLIVGLLFSPNEKIGVGLSIHAPLKGNAEREIVREIEVPADNQSSRITATDDFFRPLTLNASLMTSIPLKSRSFSMRFGLNLLYCDWSKYKFLFFGSDRSETMRNILSTSLSLGAALITSLGTFDFGFGLRIDPQPLESTDARLNHWSGGLSWKQNWLEVDLCLAHTATKIAGHPIPQTILTCTSSIRF